MLGIGAGIARDAAWLHYTQSKNRRRKLVHLAVPVPPEQGAALDVAPVGPATFIATVAARLAEVGADANEIASVTAHRTLEEVARSTAAASQRQLPATGWRVMSATNMVKSSTPGAATAEWDETDTQRLEDNGADQRMVPRGGIEPPTLRFSVACSTN